MYISKLLNKGMRYLLNPSYRFSVNNTYFPSLNMYMSDEKYVRYQFKCALGYDLDLEHPKTFCEKIQWLKLNYHHSNLTLMADKYEVKKWVANCMGDQYVVENYGVWNHFDEINISELPDMFVLKCTHDSGGLFLVSDKKTADWSAAEKKLETSLARNYYWGWREWAYKNIKPRIIAEEYLNFGPEGMMDFKFYCFNGIPKFLYISEGLAGAHEKAKLTFVTLEWEKAPFQRSDYQIHEKLPPKPSTFDQMLEVAAKLSEGLPFVRVDLYSVNNGVRFSEMTFYPTGGYAPFYPDEYERRIGDFIVF